MQETMDISVATETSTDFSATLKKLLEASLPDLERERENGENKVSFSQLRLTSVYLNLYLD